MNTSPPNSNATIVTLNAEQQSRLDANLDSLRSATESLAMPAAFEGKLMSAFKAHQAKKRRREVLAQWFAPGFALAASVGMSAWMVLAPMAQPALDAGPDAMAMLANAETPFIALKSLEQIALEPQPRLIETAVPRMLLASYGVPISPEVAGDSLRAEMLVSANGQPLAMRFLP
jgi:hypothetical protein